MRCFAIIIASVAPLGLAYAQSPFQTLDLNVNQSQSAAVDGKPIAVQLLAIGAGRDPVRSLIRQAWVRVRIAGVEVKLNCGNYQLPVMAGGVLADCAVTKDYCAGLRADPWALTRDARVRIWSGSTISLPPGGMIYPVHQRWFADQTQMANEPAFMNGGEVLPSHNPTARPGIIYYHYGLDIGGPEGMLDVFSATGGLVVQRGTAGLPDYRDQLIEPRYESVHILASNGWYYRYSHLQSIDPSVRLGGRVNMGQKIGVLGKEGNSGGWSHLHFQILGRQPSGRLGTIEGYALLWEAYLREYKPDLIAVARPHLVALAGEKVTLDGSRSWSRDGKIVRYEWRFSDGGQASGAVVQHVYPRAGSYSEMLKISDSRGRESYDFATVDIVDAAHPEQLPISLHATCSPAMEVRAGAGVTFKARVFNSGEGEETWDFGDGSRPAITKSNTDPAPLAANGYATTTHIFSHPGDYFISVQRVNRSGYRATARLYLHVIPG